MCCFVRCILTGEDIGNVRQDDMPSLRLLAVLEIVTGAVGGGSGGAAEESSLVESDVVGGSSGAAASSLV